MHRLSCLSRDFEYILVINRVTAILQCCETSVKIVGTILFLKKSHRELVLQLCRLIKQDIVFTDCCLVQVGNSHTNFLCKVKTREPFHSKSTYHCNSIALITALGEETKVSFHNPRLAPNPEHFACYLILIECCADCQVLDRGR